MTTCPHDGFHRSAEDLNCCLMARLEQAHTEIAELKGPCGACNAAKREAEQLKAACAMKDEALSVVYAAGHLETAGISAAAMTGDPTAWLAEKMRPMREALGPFARAHDAVESGDTNNALRLITLHDLRQAQKAIAPTEEP